MKGMLRGCLVVALVGCHVSGTFHCMDDSQCIRGPEMGVCMMTFCTYADGTCASGLRYDDSAQSLSNACVTAADAGVDAMPDSFTVPPCGSTPGVSARAHGGLVTMTISGVV